MRKKLLFKEPPNYMGVFENSFFLIPKKSYNALLLPSFARHHRKDYSKRTEKNINTMMR